MKSDLRVNNPYVWFRIKLARLKNRQKELFTLKRSSLIAKLASEIGRVNEP